MRVHLNNVPRLPHDKVWSQVPAPGHSQQPRPLHLIRRPTEEYFLLLLMSYLRPFRVRCER